MLKRIKATAAQLRDFAANLFAGGADTTTVDPLLIKARIPRPWFTKKRTPSRIAEAKRVFGSFTIEQQEYAITRGWFPAHWAPVVHRARGGGLTKRKVIHEGNAVSRVKV